MFQLYLNHVLALILIGLDKTYYLYDFDYIYDLLKPSMYNVIYVFFWIKYIQMLMS